jgi:hypothetical protein
MEWNGSKALSMMLEGGSEWSVSHSSYFCMGKISYYQFVMRLSGFHSHSGHSSKEKYLSHCQESTLVIQPVS